MATYKSRYVELGFYVNGNYHQFRNGMLKTEDPEVIKVLDNLSDVVRIDEPKEEPAPAEEKTPKGQRKTSAK